MNVTAMSFTISMMIKHTAVTDISSIVHHYCSRILLQLVTKNCINL